MTVAGNEGRKAIRADVPAELYFNILGSAKEYSRGQASVLKRLGAIDAAKPPQARTESQILLARIDQKLSLLVGILAETVSRKNYANHAAVLDVSEFGLGFAHTMALAKGTTLEMGLQLPTGDSSRIMDVAGTIVNVNTSSGSGEGAKNIYGVEFFDIQSKDQNEIVQLIFAHQREQIRRRREKESF